MLVQCGQETSQLLKTAHFTSDLDTGADPGLQTQLIFRQLYPDARDNWVQTMRAGHLGGDRQRPPRAVEALLFAMPVKPPVR